MNVLRLRHRGLVCDGAGFEKVPSERSVVTAFEAAQ